MSGRVALRWFMCCFYCASCCCCTRRVWDRLLCPDHTQVFTSFSLRKVQWQTRKHANCKRVCGLSKYKAGIFWSETLCTDHLEVEVHSVVGVALPYIVCGDDGRGNCGRGAFVYFPGTSACRGCSTRAPLAFLLGWVGWGALVWGAYLGWCFYSVCGFTFATWHCTVCVPQAGGSCAHLSTYPGSGRGAAGCVGGGGEAVGGIAAAVVHASEEATDARHGQR